MHKLAPKPHPKLLSSQCLWLLCVAALALLLGALTPAALAQESAIPNAPERWVTDTAGLLSAETTRALDAQLEAYEQQTAHQVIVWIGTSLGSMPVEDFAVKAFETWQPGRKGKDDGVLLIVLAQDRRIAIEVGYGLEAQVPDALASRIINDVMVPKLRAGDADGALRSGVDALLQAIEGKPFAADPVRPGVEKGRRSTAQFILFALLGVAFLLLLIKNPTLALSLLFVMGGRGGSGGGGGFSGGGGRSGGGGARGSW